MARDNESTVQWKLDISNLKRGMQDARREISLANAEFKNATAGMGQWSRSATGLEAKTQQLTKVLDGQNRILADLKQEYQVVSAEMGETSPEAQRLQIAIEKQEAACKNTQAQLDGYNAKLADLKAAQAEADSPISRLNTTISKQEDELADLKRQYASSIVGDSPEEASRLADEIVRLSSDLADNKKRLSAAEEAADELDRSIDSAGDSAEEAANGGFTVLKGTLANLVSDGISRCIDWIHDLAGEAVSSADSLKKFESTMSFAGYDPSTIETARARVKKYADDTVYDLDTIANTTAQLAANGIQDFSGLTEAAGNLNAVAGGNADTFNSVAMVLTQTAGAGKLTTENWNQLANAIPGASGELQKALLDAGAYTGNFRDAMAKGEITADEFNAAVMAIGNEPVAVEAATSVSTFEGAMGNLQATIVSGLMEIYDQIGSENITGFITGVSDAIQGMIPYIRDAVRWVLDNKAAIISALAGIAAGITAMTVVQSVMNMVEAFKAWKIATEGMTIAQRLLNAVQAANPIGLVISLIAGLVAAFATLMATNEDFRNKVLEIWDSVKKFVGDAVGAIVNFFTVTVPDGIKAMLVWFQQLPDNIGKFIAQALANVVAWATNMTNRAKMLGSMFLTNVLMFIAQLPGRIGAYAMQALASVSSWVAGMVSRGRDAGSRFLSNVIAFVQQLPGRVWGFLSNVLGNVGSWAGGLASRGAAAARSLFNSVVNTISSLPGRVASIGSNLVRGLWNGIRDMTGWVIGKIKGFGDSVLTGLKNFFGIHSPSRVMRDQVGKMLAAGIAVGFGDEMPVALRSMRKDMSGVVDALGGKVSISPDVALAGIGGADVAGATAGGAGVQNVIFNQTINSPTALDRLSIYRDTRSVIFTAKNALGKNVGGVNV